MSQYGVGASFRLGGKRQHGALPVCRKLLWVGQGFEPRLASGFGGARRADRFPHLHIIRFLVSLTVCVLGVYNAAEKAWGRREREAAAEEAPLQGREAADASDVAQVCQKSRMGLTKEPRQIKKSHTKGKRVILETKET